MHRPIGPIIPDLSHGSARMVIGKWPIIGSRTVPFTGGLPADGPALDDRRAIVPKRAAPADRPQIELDASSLVPL